jgi:hypothetical protein
VFSNLLFVSQNSKKVICGTQTGALLLDSWFFFLRLHILQLFFASLYAKLLMKWQSEIQNFDHANIICIFVYSVTGFLAIQCQLIHY